MVVNASGALSKDRKGKPERKVKRITSQKARIGEEGRIT